MLRRAVARIIHGSRENGSHSGDRKASLRESRKEPFNPFKPSEFAREQSEVSSPRRRGGGQRRGLNGWNGLNSSVGRGPLPASGGAYCSIDESVNNPARRAHFRYQILVHRSVRSGGCHGRDSWYWL